MSENILQALKDCPMVKNIPTGISSLLKIISQEDVDINKLIPLLEQFPVVCVRLILAANSAWAAPKTEITDVKRASIQLGLKTVKSITIALLVSHQFNTQKCKSFDERAFWINALIAADLMHLQESKQPYKTQQPATAHLIGLVHNLGILAIAEIAADKFSRARLIANNTKTSFSKALEDELA